MANTDDVRMTTDRGLSQPLTLREPHLQYRKKRPRLRTGKLSVDPELRRSDTPQSPRSSESEGKAKALQKDAAAVVAGGAQSRAIDNRTLGGRRLAQNVPPPRVHVPPASPPYSGAPVQSLPPPSAEMSEVLQSVRTPYYRPEESLSNSVVNILYGPDVGWDGEPRSARQLSAKSTFDMRVGRLIDYYIQNSPGATFRDHIINAWSGSSWDRDLRPEYAQIPELTAADTYLVARATIARLSLVMWPVVMGLVEGYEGMKKAGIHFKSGSQETSPYDERVRHWAERGVFDGMKYNPF